MPNWKTQGKKNTYIILNQRIEHNHKLFSEHCMDMCLAWEKKGKLKKLQEEIKIEPL